MHYLDSLSKGRQVLKFLSKSKKPFTNRQFQVSVAKIREQEAQEMLQNSINKKQQAELLLEMKRSTISAGDEKSKSASQAKDVL